MPSAAICLRMVRSIRLITINATKYKNVNASMREALFKNTGAISKIDLVVEKRFSRQGCCLYVRSTFVHFFVVFVIKGKVPSGNAAWSMAD